MPRSDVSFKRFLDTRHNIKFFKNEECSEEDESDENSAGEIISDKSLKILRKRSIPTSNVATFIDDAVIEMTDEENLLEMGAEGSSEVRDFHFNLILYL